MLFLDFVTCFGAPEYCLCSLRRLQSMEPVDMASTSLAMSRLYVDRTYSRTTWRNSKTDCREIEHRMLSDLDVCREWPFRRQLGE